MPYIVHRLAVDENTSHVTLEIFLNQMEGELSAVIPYTVPTFQGMGATAKVGFLLIVESVGSAEAASTPA